MYKFLQRDVNLCMCVYVRMHVYIHTFTCIYSITFSAPHVTKILHFLLRLAAFGFPVSFLLVWRFCGICVCVCVCVCMDVYICLAACCLEISREISRQQAARVSSFLVWRFYGMYVSVYIYINVEVYICVFASFTALLIWRVFSDVHVCMCVFVKNEKKAMTRKRICVCLYVCVCVCVFVCLCIDRYNRRNVCM